MDKKLGGGSQGEVYLVSRTSDGSESVKEEYAVKVMKPFQADPSLKPVDIITVNNIEAMGDLPNDFGQTYSVKAFGTISGVLLMEFVDGETVRDMLQKSSETRAEDAWKVAIQIAHYLYLVRQKGLINIDYNADDMVMRRDGSLKFIDINVADFSDGIPPGRVSDVRLEGLVFVNCLLSLKGIDTKAIGPLMGTVVEWGKFSKRQQYEIGEWFNDFALSNPELSVLTAFELDLLQGRNRDYSEGEYRERLLLSLYLAKKEGVNLSGLPQSLLRQAGELDDEWFQKTYGEIKFVDFPSAPELSGQEIELLDESRRRSLLKPFYSKEIFELARYPQLIFSDLVWATKEIYDRDSLAGREFYDVLSEKTDELSGLETRLNFNLLQAKSGGGATKAIEKQIEHFIDNNRSLDEFIKAELEKVTFSLTPEDIGVFYQAIIKKTAILGLLRFRESLWDRIQRKDLQGADIDGLYRIYKKYREVRSPNENDLDHFVVDFNEEIGKTIAKYRIEDTEG